MSLGDLYSFIHLSDPHLPESRETKKFGVKSYERLFDTIDAIDQLEYKPKFAIITGDLSQNGVLNGYKFLKEYITTLNIPTFLALGNNDNRENFREIFTSEKCARAV